MQSESINLFPCWIPDKIYKDKLNKLLMGWPISLCASLCTQGFGCETGRVCVCLRVSAHQFKFLPIHLYARMCICVSSVLCKLVRVFFFSFPLKQNHVGSLSAVAFHRFPRILPPTSKPGVFTPDTQVVEFLQLRSKQVKDVVRWLVRKFSSNFLVAFDQVFHKSSVLDKAGAVQNDILSLQSNGRAEC